MKFRTKAAPFFPSAAGLRNQAMKPDEDGAAQTDAGVHTEKKE
jgi:hypothetical protein